MKLNYHKTPLYLYLQIQETDGLRKVTLFEDFDETFLNPMFQDSGHIN